MKDDQAVSFEETPPTVLAEAVMSALADRDRARRREAIETASTWADPEELLACVGDPSDSRRRNAAMDALVRGGLRSVPVLIKACLLYTSP
ncbi:MAG: hypothetical protein QUU85_08130, partial [Candidatus Eisenbacteria bacterium]|nr:hypothetical protein [Candidatus Eisenbacteria bacterium]